jgi:ribosomal protein S18 acetylase RimI-like enzyme
VAVEIIEEPVSALPEYEAVPIAFRVESCFDVLPIDGGLGGLRFVEKVVAPYIKDYDANESERPSRWPTRFDMSHWGILSAFSGTQRVGGAALVWKTPEIDLLEGREDLACLWDLRVHPDYRGAGIGHLLFQRALTLARERQCRQLKVETQNTNVPACRFYVRQGCELSGVNRFAYREELDEIQLLWQLNLEIG